MLQWWGAGPSTALSDEGAQDLDYGRVVSFRGIVSEPLQGVDAPQAYVQGILVAQLLDGPGEPLGDLALPGQPKLFEAGIEGLEQLLPAQLQLLPAELLVVLLLAPVVLQLPPEVPPVSRRLS